MLKKPPFCQIRPDKMTKNIHQQVDIYMLFLKTEYFCVIYVGDIVSAFN